MHLYSYFCTIDQCPGCRSYNCLLPGDYFVICVLCGESFCSKEQIEALKEYVINNEVSSEDLTQVIKSIEQVEQKDANRKVLNYKILQHVSRSYTNE